MLRRWVINGTDRSFTLVLKFGKLSAIEPWICPWVTLCVLELSHVIVPEFALELLEKVHKFANCLEHCTFI